MPSTVDVKDKDDTYPKDPRPFTVDVKDKVDIYLDDPRPWTELTNCTDVPAAYVISSVSGLYCRLQSPDVVVSLNIGDT
jgi:hypothetical protein